jgi:hypothetical protein
VISEIAKIEEIAIKIDNIPIIVFLSIKSPKI